MKLLSKVVWSEGMYLAPHHFQAQNRYFEDSVHFATAHLWPAAYGFASCQLNEEAIRNGTVAVLNARGIFADGLAFEMPECDPLPEARTVGSVFSPTAESLTLYLAVPRESSAGPNCTLQDGFAEAQTRFIGYFRTLSDENTGQDEKPVCLGRKNIRLLLEGELTEQLQALPIARVRRDSSGNFVLDPAFIPPCVRLSASQRLVSLLRRLVEILEEKSAAISRSQPRSGGGFEAGISSGHVAQFWFLHSINASLAPLRHFLVSKHGHPQELYREMLRLGGALCTFGIDSHPGSLPAYDHEHMDGCFEALDTHIRQHLETLMPSRTIMIPLTSEEHCFFDGMVRDDRCFGRTRWILGINAGVGEAELIVKTPQLVKVCSSKFVRELVKRAIPGLTLTHLPVPPSTISARVDYQYFALSKSGPCWDHIRQSKQVGVYVPGELPKPELELTVVLES